MKKAIVEIVYDDDYLEQEGLSLESEINGWLSDSKIQVVSITEQSTEGLSE